MLIGIPKEIKTHEYRVGMTPSSVRELIHHGHQAIVQTNVGRAIGLDDAMYQAAGAEIVEISEHTSFSRRVSALCLSLLVPLLARARKPPPKSLLPRLLGLRVAVDSCGCGESRSIRSRASTISWPRPSLRHSGIDDGLLRGGGGGVSELARLLAHLSGALPSTSKLVVMARGNAGLGDTCGCSISRSTSGLDDRRLDGLGEDSASSHSCRQEARRSSGSTGRTGCNGPASLTVTA